MAKLIDFDRLKDTVESCGGNWTEEERHGAELMLDIAEHLVEEQEEADVVRVVRCKDCMESVILGDPEENKRYCAHLGFRVEDEGFCADGERGAYETN